MLDYLAAADASLRPIAEDSVLCTVVELKIFDSPQYLFVKLLLDDFPSDDSVGLKRLILVELLVDLIDLPSLYLILLFL